MWFAAVWAMWSNAPLTVSQGREGPGLVEGPSLLRATGKVFRKQKLKLYDINIIIIQTLQLIKWFLNLLQPTSPNSKGQSLWRNSLLLHRSETYVGLLCTFRTAADRLPPPFRGAAEDLWTCDSAGHRCPEPEKRERTSGSNWGIQKEGTSSAWHWLLPTFLIKKEKLSAAKMRMCSFLCAKSVLYKLIGRN